MQPIDYAARIARVAKSLGDGALLLMAQPEAVRNATTHFSYRQHSSLYYLTGLVEPETALLIVASRDPKDQVHLFVRPKDAFSELWQGKRLGVDAAKQCLAVDQVYPISELEARLPDLLQSAANLHCEFGVSDERDRLLLRLARSHKLKYRRKAARAQLPLLDAEAIMGPLRLYKSSDEVDRIRKAAQITAEAFHRVYRDVRPGWNERRVQGLLLGTFLELGSEMEAYSAIVAGGANACCLHYTENNAELRTGDLLLIDAGSQFDYYASDVTRTFPIGKEFSAQQRDLYTICLQAQASALSLCQPGSSLPILHDKATQVIAQGLIDLGLLQGSVQSVIEDGQIKRYFPHGLSHWIGMDVHDLGPYYEEAEPLALRPGMYFSVEPGIYIQPDDETVPAQWRGIGIRIEDDVLITEHGHEVTTDAIPKQIVDLENRY